MDVGDEVILDDGRKTIIEAISKDGTLVIVNGYVFGIPIGRVKGIKSKERGQK